MSEIELLRSAYASLPGPTEETTATARAALLELIASQTRAFRTPPRLRVVLIALAILLALAAIATATYFGIHRWVSAGPRGVQFAPNYRLATAFATPAAPAGEWTSFALSPNGHDVYAIRRLEVLRIAAVDRGARRAARPILDLRRLTRPGWRPARGGTLTVAPNGDLFVAVPGSGGPELVVVQRDGSWRVLLTAGELVRKGLFPKASSSWQLAASAADRVWVFVAPLDANGPQRLLELVDDRIVRTIALPRQIPFARQATHPFAYEPEWSWQLVAEPGRPHSVLAGIFDGKTAELSVYRISDHRPVKVHLLLRRRNVIGGALRLAAQHGRLIIAGLTRPDRLSLVSPTGAVTDIGRSFPLVSVLAGPNGTVYPIARLGTGSLGRWVIYRLRAAAGLRPAPALPSLAATAFRPPVGRVSRVVFEERGSSFTVAADGRNPQRLLSDRHAHDVCESADHRSIAYDSDTEAPNEFFLYAARLGDGHARKLTERRFTGFGCPFATGRLLIFVPEGFGPAYTLLRHDVRTGRDVVIAEHVDRFRLSPDGTKVAYVGGVRWQGQTRLPSSRESLEVVDLNTLRRTRLAGPLTSGRVGFGVDEAFGLHWSPDGRLIEYFVGANDNFSNVQRHTVLWVRAALDGRPVLRLPLTGGLPTATWSRDDQRLLVCFEARGFVPSCPTGPGDFGFMRHARSTPARLLLVDLRSGASRVVARGHLIFAGWAPSGAAFAYATPRELFLETTTGRTSLLATAPGRRWQGHYWPGFSPDGRYIAIDTGPTNGIPVVDVRARRLRILRPLGRRIYENVGWWR